MSMTASEFGTLNAILKCSLVEVFTRDKVNISPAILEWRCLASKLNYVCVLVYCQHCLRLCSMQKTSVYCNLIPRLSVSLIWECD